MNWYVTIGRIFLGVCLAGIGVLHLFFPGIRPILLPDLTNIPTRLYWIVYAAAILLIGCGVLISINKKVNTLALIVGIAFFLLFLFGHLPAYLYAVDRAGKLKYWVNLNKTLALSGGFLILASLRINRASDTKSASLKAMSLIGRIFFAIMLFLFGLGHMLSTTALSAMVPAYIPFAAFWTFTGGIILIGAAISFVIKWQMKKMALILAATLFIWLITLHLYYAIRFPLWQEGENFIGLLTCLAFCGTALLISQSSKEVSAATAKE